MLYLSTTIFPAKGYFSSGNKLYVCLIPFKLDAKNRARQTEVEKGKDDELTEFDIKKQEKEKHVEELKQKLAEVKNKEDEARGKIWR